MNQQEINSLRIVIETIASTLRGEIPPPIDTSVCDSPIIIDLVQVVNKLVASLDEAKNFLDSISRGKLEIEPPRGNHLISSFKQLHSDLKHLKWQTKQVAQGDYSQSVDFLDDFSDAFNEMIHSLRQKKEVEQQREILITELQEAMAQVKTLKGLLPICAHCKKIRDDQGYWNTVEKYIYDRSEVEFTHGICPDCLKKHYSEFYKEK